MGPFEVVGINKNQIRVRDLEDENHIKYTNVRMMKPYKVSPYTMVQGRALSMLERDGRVQMQRVVDYVTKAKMYGIGSNQKRQ